MEEEKKEGKSSDLKSTVRLMLKFLIVIGVLGLITVIILGGHYYLGWW